MSTIPVPSNRNNLPKKIPGTKTSALNSQLLISSGVPSLDHVIGGGIPVGSVLLLEEDVSGNYSRVMLKYFLAEGVISKHSVLLASLDNDPETMMDDLPSPTIGDNELTTSNSSSGDVDSDIKIAWRYKSLDPVTSTLQSNLQFGHYFDLSKKIDSQLRNMYSESYWTSSAFGDGGNCSENIAYKNLLGFINKEIETKGFSKKHLEKNYGILRIAIESLGSPYWQIHDSDDRKSSEAQDLIKFIYCLRSIVRFSSAVAFLSIPTHIFENLDTVFHIYHSVDIALKLDSFAGTDREFNPVLRDYHGFFKLPKLSSINTLVPYVPSTLDLAFKLRRKKFLIEKLHLPPELQDSSEREQDDSESLSCSGSKNKSLDF